MGGKKEYELTIELGHKSTPLHQKQPNGYTHKWTVYVKGVNNCRIDYCIQRVVFQLHESFDNPHRDISQPPYKIKETGYAGFEIPIEIYFKNKDKHNNHCFFVHDLCLLTNKEHKSFSARKVKFINPDRDFEKCLIKSGAQLLTNNVKKEKIKSPPPPQPPPPLPPAKKKKRDSPPIDVKKERHESPPSNKKQKSSSVLIPSKDMGRQPTPQSQNQQSQSGNHHNHHNHNHHHHHHNNSISNNSSNNNNNNHHSHRNHHNHHSNHHNHSQHHNTTNKVKPSKEFIDVFGAPLVYNQGTVATNTTTTTNTTSSNNMANSTPTIATTITPSTITTTTTASTTTTNSTTTTSANTSLKPTVNSSHHRNGSTSSGTNNNKQTKDDLQLILSKISCLSDCDRLQKIVDIIEEAGEWYNLTPKKFEFDLKRLDRKTLSKIERCLQQH